MGKHVIQGKARLHSPSSLRSTRRQSRSSGDLWRLGLCRGVSPGKTHRGVLAMLHFVRRSLLVQLLSVYLLFVVIVLIGGVGVNAAVEQQLRSDVQASDQALAQEIALETSFHLRDTENALVALGK